MAKAQLFCGIVFVIATVLLAIPFLFESARRHLAFLLVPVLAVWLLSFLALAVFGIIDGVRLQSVKLLAISCVQIVLIVVFTAFAGAFEKLILRDIQKERCNEHDSIRENHHSDS